MPKKYTQEEFIKQLSIEHPNLELLSNYRGNKEYVTVKCKIHNYKFHTKPNWLHKGCGCKKCYDERRGDTTRKKITEIIGEAKKVHGNKYDYSLITEYKNNRVKFPILCRKKDKDGVEHGLFFQTPLKHIKLREGCPQCNSSHLENEIRIFLRKNGIFFIEQKRFDWLGKQSLDFYLPHYKYAIECQGEQHFKSIPYFGDNVAFQKQIELDLLKFNLCEEKSIKILYFTKNKPTDNIPKIYSESNLITENSMNKIQEFLKE